MDMDKLVRRLTLGWVGFWKNGRDFQNCKYVQINGNDGCMLVDYVWMYILRSYIMHLCQTAERKSSNLLPGALQLHNTQLNC
jgi:hypothetical protein